MNRSKRTLTLPLVIVLIVALLAVAAASWWFRPWSPYSPSVMTKLLHPEYRLENFRHMEKVFPFHVIPASAEPFTFPHEKTATLPAQFSYDGRIINSQEFMERSETTGLMVLHQGNNLFEQYFLDAQPSDRFTSWSVAKTVVATLAAIAQAEGHIESFDDPVKRYVSELEGKAWGEVPIRELLRMGSGMQFDENYDDKFSDINMLFYRTFLLGQGVRDIIVDLPAARPAGETFEYLSPNTQILAWVVEQAVGQPLSKYTSSALWQPLGMQDDALWSVDQSGVEMAFCCLNMTLRDYAKLGQLYLQQGVWRSQPLLPQDWVAQTHQLQQLKPQKPVKKSERDYGYHLWMPKNAQQEYFFNGVWGQSVWVDEQREVVIVKTSVDPLFRQHMGEMIAFMRALSSHIGNQSSSSEAASH